MKKKILLIIIGIVVLLLGTLFMPFSFTRCKLSTTDSKYEYVMKDVFKDKNPYIRDIAMLGAHDAFSSGISYSSKPNVNEGGITNNKVVNTIGKGLVVRMSKAQNASAKEMLYNGVRYFDVRITLIDGVYYTTHGYLSNTLESYLKDVVDYLGTHTGEFIIFDIQHFYTPDGSNYDLSSEAYTDLLKYMMKVTNDKGLSLLDYVHYNSVYDENISELRYNDVTKGKTDAGVVILAKVKGISSIFYRDNDATKNEADTYTNIRSYWHNTNSNKDMLSGIDSEVEFVKDHLDIYSKLLRVNQAQKTGFIMDISLVNSLVSWSILDMANNFNAKLVKDKSEFTSWLEYLPILMVDNVTSTKGNFNALANDYIIDYNKTL